MTVDNYDQKHVKVYTSLGAVIAVLAFVVTVIIAYEAPTGAEVIAEASFEELLMERYVAQARVDAFNMVYPDISNCSYIRKRDYRTLATELARAQFAVIARERRDA
jgi:hypothetical protein